MISKIKSPAIILFAVLFSLFSSNIVAKEAPQAESSNYKIAVFSAMECYEKSKVWSEFSQTLKNKQKLYLNSYKAGEKKIKEMENEIRDKGNSLSEAELSKKRKELQDLKEKVKKEMEESAKKITQEMEEASKKIITLLNEVISDYSKKNNISVVFNRSSEAVMFVNSNAVMDITAQIIELIDQKQRK